MYTTFVEGGWIILLLNTLSLVCETTFYNRDQLLQESIQQETPDQCVIMKYLKKAWPTPKCSWTTKHKTWSIAAPSSGCGKSYSEVEIILLSTQSCFTQHQAFHPHHRAQAYHQEGRRQWEVDGDEPLKYYLVKDGFWHLL